MENSQLEASAFTSAGFVCFCNEELCLQLKVEGWEAEISLNRDFLLNSRALSPLNVTCGEFSSPRMHFSLIISYGK